MQKIQIILSLLRQFLPTSRPRFWIYILGPFLIGFIAAQDHINTATLLSFLGFSTLSFFVYFSYPANLLIYGINDIFDYETDKNNPKKSDYESLLTPEKQQIARIIIAGLNIPFILLSILPNIQSYLWLIIFVVSSIFYSAPPLRAKARPVLDTIISALVYIAPGFVGYYISGGTEFSWFTLFALLARNMGMHAYSAIPDIEADKVANINTVATFYGKQGTLVFCIICYTLAMIFSIPSIGRFSAIACVYIIVMILSFRNNIFGLYRFFPWINGIVGFLLFRYIVFINIQFL